MAITPPTFQTGTSATVLPPNSWSIGGRTFDAFLRMSEDSTLTATSHPVELGAAITDHSYINPRQFSFEIGVSNCNESPNFPGLSSERNVNAFNWLVGLQRTRTPTTLVTKYGQYINILIMSVRTDDTWLTKNTLKAQVTCQEIIIAATQNFRVSSAPQITNSTPRGQVAAQPIRPNLVDRVFRAVGVPLLE